jgi:hypothetical protein
LMIGEFTCWLLIKGGLPPIPVLEKATNGKTSFAYSVAGAYATSEATSVIDSGLATIRKALGIDICGKETDAYSATLSSQDIPYQQSVQLKVKFSNSKNNTGRIQITGSGLRSIHPYPYNLPESMRKQGEISATISNLGYRMDNGQCNSAMGSFLAVTVISTSGEQLFYKQFKPVNYIGKLSGSTYPCSASVSW